MCGICGVVRFDGARPDESLLRAQLRALRHRGPDDHGLWIDGPVGLAQARLSILDLSAGGHQPLANENGRLQLVCNGEFYGADAQREALRAGGHVFAGRSDSEIALHLYEEHGDGALAHLRGMFAFALYDTTRARLLIARDRMGKKPLFYTHDAHRLAFASEAKALLLDPSVPRDLDEASLVAALALRYVPGPETAWRAIRELAPAHALIADADGVREVCYWQSADEPERVDDEAVLAAEVRLLLEDAVRVRLASDVPVGALLSGGADSASVVALMRAVSGHAPRTYTVTFAGHDVCEGEAAREVAAHLGCTHTEVPLGPESLADLPQLIWQMDEPFADPSLVPTHAVAARASADVKVALSGDGGDEVFAGYKTYPAAERHARLAHMPGVLRRAIAGAGGMLGARDATGMRMRRIGMSIGERHVDAMSCYLPAELLGILGPALREAANEPRAVARILARHQELALVQGEVAALPRLDAETYLASDVLRKVDRASMMHGLEVRSPLLDDRLVARLARVPFTHKLRGGRTKWILKRAVADLLPEHFLERPKRGFSMPISAWLRGPARGMVDDVLGDPRTRARGWVRAEVIDATRRGDPSACGRDAAHHQWTLMCLELWARTYVDRPREALGEPLAALGASVVTS